MAKQTASERVAANVARMEAEEARSTHRIAVRKSHAGNWSYRVCGVCGGWDAFMPTECPGEQMTGIQRTAVGNEDIDFVGGKWVDLLFG